jgi:S1-C subfamily serine protease
MNKKVQLTIIISVVVSLIIGATGGVFGALFLGPYLLDRGIVPGYEQIINQKTVISFEEESATTEVVEKSIPSVVSIVVSKELQNITGPFAPFFFFDQDIQDQLGQKQRVGGGTGFIISEDGLILTNKHVVLDDDAEYTVILNDNRSFEAEVLGRDFINDIAILKIDAQDLPTLTLGDSDQIEIGQTVIAIGYTLGEYQNTVTKGVISGIDRRVVAEGSFIGTDVIEEAIQTDTAINPGNSGGPLLNLNGEVIAINTAVNREGEAIGFAIPINTAKHVVESIKTYGRIVRPWLGVRYVNINATFAQVNDLPYNYGALISRGDAPGEVAIVPDSPADKAGLAANDIILEINSTKLDDTSLARELLEHNPGDEIELKIHRDGQEQMVKVTLEEREE